MSGGIVKEKSVAYIVDKAGIWKRVGKEEFDETEKAMKQPGFLVYIPADPPPVTDTFGVGWAVEAMKRGKRVRRRGWNGKGMHVFILEPNSMVTQPFVAMYTADENIVPWLCSQTDLLANDWEVVE